MIRLAVLLAVCVGAFAQVEPGVLPQSWMTGGPDCVTVPDWQVHAYNDRFYILRESGCIHYEKPFLYLIFGDDRVLLEDTGAGNVNTATFVQGLIAKWAKAHSRSAPTLVVVHSHAHGDHTAGDKDLKATAGVEFIAPTSAAIAERAGIGKWPDTLGSIDLGNRVVDVIPIPGHNDASIALYDRRTGILLTGDSLYPGRLYVNEPDLDTYAASARRLADFVRGHAITHVLGTHIEQTDTAFADYPVGTTYQPHEHALALTRAHVIELEDAFNKRKEGDTQPIQLPDFTISIRPARKPR